jgi:hypothetical protein
MRREEGGKEKYLNVKADEEESSNREMKSDARALNIL